MSILPENEQKTKIPHIIRAVHDKDNPFVMLNKQAARDCKLSLEAVGLWTRIFCHKDEWTIHVTQLMKANNIGKDKMYRILRELVTNGYAFHAIPRENGKFTNGTWYVFETKRTEEEIKKMFPNAENPYAVKPDEDNPPLINTNNNNPSFYKTSLDENKGECKEPTPPLASKSEKEKKRKILFGRHVQLFEGEFETLCNELGKELVEYYINAIDLFVPNRKEGPYKDYAAVVRQWALKDRSEGKTPRLEKIKEATRQPIAQKSEGAETVAHITRICNRLDERLRARVTAQTFFYARGDHALMVNKHKDFQKEYYYKAYSLEEFKQIILQDLDICFPGAREYLFPNTDNKVNNLIKDMVVKTQLCNGG